MDAAQRRRLALRLLLEIVRLIPRTRSPSKIFPISLFNELGQKEEAGAVLKQVFPASFVLKSLEFHKCFGVVVPNATRFRE
jgi:hypothetical protein